MTARPGWDTLIDRTGLSRSTIQRALRRLRSWGLLGTVASGSTWRIRGGRDDDEHGNLAGEYVLCIPVIEAVEESDPPSSLRQEAGSPPRVRAREDCGPRPAAALWPIGKTPVTRREQLDAAQRLRKSPVLRQLSARYLRHLLRPVFAAGWSPAQVLHALDHAPDDVAYWHTDQVNHVAAWVRHRLAAWRDDDGTWATPPAQLGAGRTTDLEHADVVELRNAPRLTGEQTAEHAGTARWALDAVRARLARRKPTAQAGLGVSLPDEAGRITTATEAPGQAGWRDPYDADDPRHRYASAADADAAADLIAASRRAVQHGRLLSAGEGFDWLLRGLRARGAGAEGAA